MKKIFSIASALMLALCMGMTSCSNDIDEVVTEQQPEMHKLYLSATAPNSPETRSYAEGVKGKEDAIKITGWKAGDVIYGYYGIAGANPREATCGKLTFTFNSTTNKFESESTTVTNDQIKYFLYGNLDYARRDLSYNSRAGSFSGNLWYNSLTIDVANNYTNIPMWGTASVEGDKLTTNMQLIDVAFLCLHNSSSSASIDVIIARYSSYFKNTNYSTNNNYVQLTFNGSNNIARFMWPIDQNKANATVTKIAAGEKAYLPIAISTSDDYTVQVFIGDNDTPFASKAQNAFVSGKIYKLNYTGQ